MIQSNKRKFNGLSSKGFTLLEILLVVAAIAILMTVVLVALNPANRLADTRNARRSSDVSAVLSAVHLQAMDNGGILHANIPAAGATSTEICGCPVGDCLTNVPESVDLCFLVNEGYLGAMNGDPNKTLTACNATTSEALAETSCYHVSQPVSGVIKIAAPAAELDATIEATR